ncbi:flagellar filament capping protein FliD [Nocardioides panacis]|uniref:Flagellar hook-associated protein 2 n=1 Tax=Nocardioides panacis TaxID=2849501 RepID=A0A975Y0H9_9ACTN|nr:flagellar filament capping protein FliD [Nocardioides panacis]QWZ08482.1 flagellar filament capping protein FliD [Nocardioides panacis]
MAGGSVSGLVSGLDTATIISQLMQVEAAPQTLLKSKLTAEKSTVSTLQAINAKFAALTTRAHDLATAAAWSPTTATSSSTQVQATASASAVPGTLSFTVQKSASAFSMAFNSTAGSADVVTTGGTTVRLDKLDGTTPIDIETTDGTLTGVVNAINAKNAGVSAVAVKVADNSYRLRLTSTTTGLASDFALTNADGSSLLGGATTTSGKDAEILVGTDTITSSTNTFTGITQGLDITLKPGTSAGTQVDVTVARDSAGVQASLQSLVDGANEILSTIDGLTAYDPTTKTSGPLAGDSVIRDLRSKVLDTVTRTADGTSMAGLGLQTDRSGKIVLDTAKFAAAYAADPAGVSQKLGATGTDAVPGFAARLEAVGKLASDSATGSLSLSIKGHQSSATTMQDGIDAWNIRLTQRQDSLNRQFSALEVALGKMQDQASWLTGQIASLPKSSS